MTAAATAPRPQEARAATARATAFVAAHCDAAEALGRRVAGSIDDVDEAAIQLREGLRTLADPEYVEGQRLVAPGIGRTLGVRWPLIRAVVRGFTAGTRESPAAPLLFVVERLYREEPLEVRWFAFEVLERTLARQPERTWQLLRRAAREAGDWITVDSLAHPYGRGILLEPYRWAELEQLVFSPSRWERRLVGSTIATMPHVDRRVGRDHAVVEQAIPLLGQLMGDAEPDVQKALSWAWRAIAQVHRDAATDALIREAQRAEAASDGHRAWVVRDALPKIDPEVGAQLRARLANIRRRSGAPSTSDAAATAERFADLGLGRPMPEPPIA